MFFKTQRFKSPKTKVSASGSQNGSVLVPDKKLRHHYQCLMKITKMWYQWTHQMIVHWFLLGLLRSFLPPANKVCEGNVFTGVCLSTGGACMAGGHVWQRGMHGRGCAWWVHACQGACMVGGCAWQGGVHGGGICDRRHSWWGGVWCGRRDGHYSGRTGMHSCLLLKMVYFCRGRITEQPLSSYISQVTFNALLSMFITFLSSNWTIEIPSTNAQCVELMRLHLHSMMNSVDSH